MGEGTKYYPQKMCMNCFQPNHAKASSCNLCGYIFIGEATEKEYYEHLQKFAKPNKK